MLSDIQIQKKINILSIKLNAGRFDEVIDETSILLKKNKHQVFFNILSLAYQSINEFEKSEIIMNEALKISPKNPYFLNNMGTTQHKMGNFIKAEEYFMRGLKIVPKYINILNNLGNLKKDLDQAEDALKFYKKSLSINPKGEQTLLNISICYQSLGSFTEAKYHLNDLLKINPKFTAADRLISTMTKYREDDDHLKQMVMKSTEQKLNNIQQSNLFFGLGKAYEDLKKYEQSFQNYKKGNYLLKKMSNFKIEHEAEDFKNIKKIFKNNFKETKIKKSRNIIFIVGMPRSGTSLIEQIISSHKNVYGCGELNFLNKIIDSKFLSKFDNKSFDSIKDSENLLNEAHDEYIDMISAINDSDKILTDKAPLNFKYIGFIKKIFPHSKIINCKRDRLDVCWSNFKNYFADSLPFTNNFDDLGNYYKMYVDLIKFWESLFPNEIYEMEYGQLINNSEYEIKKLLKFCELDWDPNCMEHEKNSKTIKTASATQVREPINKAGLNTASPFKNYLTELSSILYD